MMRGDLSSPEIGRLSPRLTASFPLGATEQRGNCLAVITGAGAMGRPDPATAEKGNRLYDLITPCLVDFVRESAAWKPPREEAAE